uniref:Uncharacterized protein n=1 Tax=Pristionchus pacificus TaxID=54126 RepID=A0A2A6BX38_PRIPA|eukprot:PDM70331.1 hypothetical protein PRIPAC_46577 [Pristionchus pacificus]
MNPNGFEVNNRIRKQKKRLAGALSYRLDLESTRTGIDQDYDMNIAEGVFGGIEHTDTPCA